MEQRNLEQRCAIKFCAKLGEIATETYEKVLKVYGSDALSRIQVFWWHADFKKSRESVKDEARSGRPIQVQTDANAHLVRALVRQDRRLTIRMLAVELNINRETVRKILTEDFAMKKLCAKMVPISKQKAHRMNIAQDCLEQVESDPTLLDRVITSDESWFFQYDPETKRQSQQWLSPGAPRPKKARMSKFKVKTMMNCFFDSIGLVHKEFVLPGQTINQVFYSNVFERLRKRVLRVRPEIWVCITTMLLVTLRSQFLAYKCIATLPQPP